MEPRAYQITDEGFQELKASSSAPDEPPSPQGRPSAAESPAAERHAGAAGLTLSDLTVEEQERASKPDPSINQEQILFDDIQRTKRALSVARHNASSAIAEQNKLEELLIVRMNRYLTFTRSNTLWKIL